MNAIITSEDPEVVLRQLAEYVWFKMTPKEHADLLRERTERVETDFGTIVLMTHPLFSR